jgi:hypothetical protein
MPPNASDAGCESPHGKREQAARDNPVALAISLSEKGIEFGDNLVPEPRCVAIGG